MISQEIPSNPSPNFVVQGVVHDAKGRALKGVSVRINRKGAVDSDRRTTDEAGEFRFSPVESGTFTVTADEADGRSAKAEIVTGSDSPGGKAGVFEVDLVLDERGSQSADQTKPPEQEMQFADQPNFTIAGVTDWTAAGGHGSDATLRTSEALNREALTLKPSASSTASVAGKGESAQLKKTEAELQLAVERAPKSFEANRELGVFYLGQGQYREALPSLSIAYRVDPKNVDNEFDLAIACKETGDLTEFRGHVHDLMASHPDAKAHRLAGELDELENDPLSAVKEFQLATGAEPSEQNYFEWGSELLLHRAIWQAKAVLEEGSKAFPQSARMMTALGAALFAGELYDQAAARLCDASDLAPVDPEPYQFMGKIELSAPKPLPCVEQKLARFLKQEPNDALAHYYYAMALWKKGGPNENEHAAGQVEDQLQRAIALDPRCGDAYLQLGNLEFSQGKMQPAIELYTRALAVSPQLNDAHYRLGMAYDRAGEREKAKHEFELHDEIAKQQASEVDRQRRQVKQFVVSVPEPPGNSTPDR